MRPYASHSCNLTQEEKSLLIEMVKESRLIWDTKAFENGDVIKRREAFKKIAEKLSEYSVRTYTGIFFIYSYKHR